MTVWLLGPVGRTFQVQMMQLDALQVFRLDVTTECVEKWCGRCGDAVYEYFVTCAKGKLTNVSINETHPTSQRALLRRRIDRAVVYPE